MFKNVHRRVLSVFAAVIASFLFGIGAAAAVTTPMDSYWGNIPSGPGASIRYIYTDTTAGPLFHDLFINEQNTWNNYLAVNRVAVRFANMPGCVGVPGGKDCVKLRSDSTCGSDGHVAGGTSYSVLPFTSKIWHMNFVLIQGCGAEGSTMSVNNRSVYVGHELGHVLGLGHQPYYTLDPQPWDMMGTPFVYNSMRWWPSSDNMTAIKNQYGTY
jgi:hypothetical protein